MIEATVLDENRKVKVAFYEFFAKDHWDLYKSRFFKREKTRVSNLLEKGFVPDFYTTPFKDEYKSEQVLQDDKWVSNKIFMGQNTLYLFKGQGMIWDTPSLGKSVGVVFIHKKKYYVIFGTSSIEFFKSANERIINFKNNN